MALNIHPFSKQLILKIEEIQREYYSIQGIGGNGQDLMPSDWTSLLFFKYEPNFYGLHVNVDGKRIIVSTLQLVELFSPKYIHPLLQIIGEDENTNAILSSLHSIQQIWNNASLWDYVNIEKNKENQFIIKVMLPKEFEKDEFVQKFFNGNIDINMCQYLLETALYQKLQSSHLNYEEIIELIPYFKNGGWPIDENQFVMDDIKLAIRLNEPNDSLDEWVLETIVVQRFNEKIFAPATIKNHLKVINSKYGQSIQNKLNMFQQPILQFLNLSNTESFLYATLSDKQVRDFLRDTVQKLSALGMEIVLPSWLKNVKQSKIRVKVNASNYTNRSVAGLDDILSFNWKLSIEGTEISQEEFQKIVASEREMIQIGNQWVRLDMDWLKEIQQLMEKVEGEDWTVRDLLFQEIPEELSIHPEEDEELYDDPLFTFEIKKSLERFVEQLQNKQGLPKVNVPENLQTALRPYQQVGFDWLIFMKKQNFGVILADDMGLGKTVQLISYLLYLYESMVEQKPSLIICPTSVLGNWQKEFEKFAPTLKVYTHYSGNRLKNEDFHQLIKEKKHQIFLTTYGTISQDIVFLQNINWSSITLDEAQNIKNLQTIQSRSIRKLKGDHHIALTGTPIENRLSELWAIFDFIHKGYLGSFKKFQEEFIVPIEKDESEKHKKMLRTKIRPFLLRRTKRDPELMLNLPEKQEMKEFCPLTKEQAALYESYIQETLFQLENMNAFEKKGRVLQMLSKLKQLCNHPVLYLKEPLQDAKELLARSVKLERIVQLALDIVERKEQCLIFTQYIGMGHLLQYCFSEMYKLNVPFLTGSMSKAKRDELVEQFQQEAFPIFILSLKAGGTGLNLTKASHVLHADRWWNPAVENQATDRAYRIGQTKFVQVHKFITIGTIEEKIDKMIEMKSSLSNELIQSNNWLNELKDEELYDLLTFDNIY